MSEETPQENQTPESSPGTPPSSEPSIDEVAKRWNIEEEVKQLKVEPKPDKPVQQYAEPLLDPDEAYKRQIQEMGGVLRELNDQVSEIRRTTEQERLNQDVNRAVAKVNETLEVDPLLAEILLEKRYRDDPVFKRIWDNRNVHPKALEEALGIVANESKKIFNVRADPQLVENQRAAKASQRAQATSKETTEEDETANMSGAEFESWWHNRLRGF